MNNIIDDYRILKILLKKNTIDQQELFKTFQYFLLKVTENSNAFYSINQSTNSIEMKNYNKKILNYFELIKSSFYKTNWVPFSSNYIACFDNEKFEGLIERNDLGLNINTAGGGILNNNNIYLLNNWLFEFIPQSTTQTLPYDLYIFNSKCNYLFIVDRGSGKIFTIDKTLTKGFNTISIRKNETKKCINLAYFADTNSCYITDSCSPDLLILNLDNLSLNRIYQNYGQLGNLVINNTNKRLYLLTNSSEGITKIVVIKLPSLTYEHSILVTGKNFSELDDPTDLLALSPDGNYLYVMTYIDSPSLFTPLISVIKIENFQIYKTYTLNKEEKPIGLASKYIPFVPYSISFVDILLEKKLITLEELENIINEQPKQANTIQNNIQHEDEIDNDLKEISKTFFKELDKEVNSILNLNEENINKWLNNPKFSWQGRENMTSEDKKALIEKLNEIQPNQEIKKANSVFVIKWLQDFFS